MSHLFWDGLTFILLAVPLLVYFKVIKAGKIRNRTTKTVASVLLFSGFAVIFYGSFIESNIIVVKHEQLDLSQPAADGQADSTETVRIALVSDLHLGPYHNKGFVRQLIKKVEKEQADILVMAGDFVFDSEKEAEALEEFKNLAILKVAALGNHDYDLSFKGGAPQLDQNRADIVSSALTKGGVKVLVNRYVHYHDKLWIIGLDEYWTERADLKTPLEEISNDKPKIVVTHNPDTALTLSGEKIDLIMAGHTHGGQVRLPFIGPVGQIPTGLGQHYDEGFFEINGYKTYITSGLGTSGPRARLFNPPEVVIFDVKI